MSDEESKDGEEGFIHLLVPWRSDGLTEMTKSVDRKRGKVPRYGEFTLRQPSTKANKKYVKAT